MYPHYWGYAETDPALRPHLATFFALDIDDYALKTLKEVFLVADVDGSNDVDIDEFFSYFGTYALSPF